MEANVEITVNQEENSLVEGSPRSVARRASIEGWISGLQLTEENAGPLCDFRVYIILEPAQCLDGANTAEFFHCPESIPAQLTVGVLDYDFRNELDGVTMIAVGILK